MNLIKNAEFVKSSSRLAECPDIQEPEYAFIGRSNVGKSSLINMLTDRKKLAKTSATPGKTQLINHFLIDNQWYLVDLPGYGWAKVSKKEKDKWNIMINEYLQMRKNLVCVFVLVDSRHEPQSIDLQFIKDLGLAGIPFAIIFTKSDKQSKNRTASNISKYKKILKKDWEELPPVFISSSVTGEGQNEILNYIKQLNNSVNA